MENETNKKLPIRPLGGRMVCEPIKEEEVRTKMGIMLATSSDVDGKKMSYKRARVLAVGPKVVDVKVGDVLGLLDFQYTEIEHDFVTYFICTELDVEVVFNTEGDTPNHSPLVEIGVQTEMA